MPTKDNILKWAEHGLVIAGIAGITDLGANISGVSHDQFIVAGAGLVVGAAIRFLNKLGGIKDPSTSAPSIS